MARIRSTPLSALDLKPQTLRLMIERLGSSSMKDAHRFTVGNVMDAVETQTGFTPFDASSQSTMLTCFMRRLVEDEDLTYFDWHYLPPETATSFLGEYKKAQILGFDARVLDTFSNATLVHVAVEQGKTVFPGKVVLPDTVTVATLLKSRRFVAIGRQTSTFGDFLGKTREKLFSLGFTKRDGFLLEE